MLPMQTTEFVKFICSLAEKSGKVIKPYFSNPGLVVEMKEDQTVVTQADREAEAVMRNLIHKVYPDHGILGEEFGPENASAEFIWTLDPIDGTISFARGCPLFGTLIGLLHNNKPILGAIHHPVLNELCIGNNMETTVNGRVVELRAVHQLSEALLLTTDIAHIDKYQNNEAFQKLLSQTRLFRTWGDCYGYLLVASGGADIMIDAIMNPWDILPLIPIIRGANGIITTWSGTEAAQGDSCVVANKILHPRVLEILNS
jgi:histidinol phosphatase-like enzyme (inositol monophosphatase family)